MTNKLIAKKIDIFASDPNASTKILGDFSTGTGGISKDPDVLQQNTAIVIGGWLQNVLPGKAPALDHDNTLMYLITRKLKEFQQQGIPEHIDTEVYHEYSIVRKSGTYELYGCKNNDVTGDLPDNAGDEDWDFLANLNDLGGLNKNYIDNEIHYGGEFDASTQFTPNNATYNYSGYYYTFNQSINFIDFNMGNVNFKSDEFDLIIPIEFSQLNKEHGICGLNDDIIEFFEFRLLPSNQLRISLSSNGTSHDIANSETGTKSDWSLNTKYLLRVLKDTSNSQWLVQWSDDNGQSWNTDITINSSLQLFNPSIRSFYFGARVWNANYFLTGRIYLDKFSWNVNGQQILKPQDTSYIPNSIVWKGEVRSGDNTTDISSNNYIRSGIIFNANSQYTINGSGIDTYDYTDFTFNPEGTVNSNPYVSASGYSASDFDARVKFEFSNSNNTKPIIGLGSGSGNLGIVAKTNASGLMQLFISSNSTTWDISNGLTGTKIYNIDTVYIVRVHRDTLNWYLDWSDDDGDTWTNDITANSSLDMFEQTLNFNWGGDYTPGTDIFMTGKIYLDGTSLFLNGEFVLEPQDPDTATLPYSDYYYFIGFDDSDNLKLERSLNKDGSGLPTITGAKRRLGDDKDISFPTDGSGNLAYFERNYNTWEFELWSGSINSNTSITLNNAINNYTNLEAIASTNVSGMFTTSKFIKYGGYRLIGTITSDNRIVDIQYTNPTTITFANFDALSVFKISGIK